MGLPMIPGAPRFGPSFANIMYSAPPPSRLRACIPASNTCRGRAFLCTLGLLPQLPGGVEISITLYRFPAGVGGGLLIVHMHFRIGAYAFCAYARGNVVHMHFVHMHQKGRVLIRIRTAPARAYTYRRAGFCPCLAPGKTAYASGAYATGAYATDAYAAGAYAPPPT